MSITAEEVQSALPTKIRTEVAAKLANDLNQISADPLHAKHIRENFVTYGSVLKAGKFKMTDYLNAVKYVSFKIMGYTNVESYQRTFPQRYTLLTTRGASEKDISAYVAAYNKTKLVNLILEQSLISPWILNQDAFQEAINTQVKLMQTAKSEMVKSNAANSILTHLKPPEAQEVQLTVDIPEDAAINKLKASLTQLAEQQRQMIQDGTPTKEIAHHNLMGEPKGEILEAVIVEPKDKT